MCGLVQQPAVDGADWQHLSGRSRTTLLRPTGVPSLGRVTQTKSPPAIPARFSGDQSRSAAHALEGAAGSFAQVPKILSTDVRQFVVLAVCPDVLHRIQFWRVGRQVVDFQTAFLVTDELLRDFTAVSREPVPNQQNVALDRAQ